jgi:hypothetical protein
MREEEGKLLTLTWPQTQTMISIKKISPIKGKKQNDDFD